MDAKLLPATLRRYAAIIESVSDERDNADGFWCYLIPGHIEPLGGTTAVHEDTLGQCAATLSSCRTGDRDEMHNAGGSTANR